MVMINVIIMAVLKDELYSMKTFNYLLISIALFSMFGCNSPQRNQEKNTGNTTTPKAVKQCFVARFEKDSASLTLITASNGKITGLLYIKYHEIKPMELENELNVGNIEGKFNGDTLFANYTFTSGTLNKTRYTNPIALLRKGDTLIIGAGVINSYMGKSYFDKKRPLDFKRSRFHFKPVECK
jgi:hypothetical protein